MFLSISIRNEYEGFRKINTFSKINRQHKNIKLQVLPGALQNIHVHTCRNSSVQKHDNVIHTLFFLRVHVSLLNLPNIIFFFVNKKYSEIIIGIDKTRTNVPGVIYRCFLASKIQITMNLKVTIFTVSNCKHVLSPRDQLIILYQTLIQTQIVRNGANSFQF